MFKVGLFSFDNTLHELVYRAVKLRFSSYLIERHEKLDEETEHSLDLFIFDDLALTEDRMNKIQVLLKDHPKTYFIFLKNDKVFLDATHDRLIVIDHSITKQQLLELIEKVNRQLIALHPERLYIDIKGKQIDVLIKDITYLASDNHSVNVHMANATTYKVYSKLDDLVAKISSSDFWRCHKSFYINLNYITEFKNDYLYIKDDIIPIARSYKKETKIRIETFLANKAN